jgi:membrane protein YdbS with pleckstrin-like domain
MTSFNRDLRSSLLGIAAVTLFQLVVLFAIGAAVVRYLEWSSDAAQAEFTSTIEAASDPSQTS